MKKFIIILLLSTSFLLTSCNNKEIEEETVDTINEAVVNVEAETDENIVVKKEVKQEEAIYNAEWLNRLPEIEFNDIVEEKDTYSYKYNTEITQSGTIDRFLTYSKTNNEEYKGTMKLIFSENENTHIENIPKSFASHVDQLEFSVEPSRIINPDPIVEFSDIKGDLEIKSKESVSAKDIENSIEEQIINKELKLCEGLIPENAKACLLRIVSKYRDTEALQKEFDDMELLLGGDSFDTALYAVKVQGYRKCDLFPHGTNRDMCYEYAYQVLVEECNSKEGKEYRNCVRDESMKLPNMETRRLFCDYIDDADMRDECMGKAQMNVCDEIENKDQKMLCQVNIAKTEGGIESCDKVTEPDARDICRAIIGMDKGNEKYCNMVTDDYFSGECIMKVALAKNDGTMCNKIRHPSQKDLCNMSFLIREKKATKEMCNGFNDSFLRELCQTVLIIQENDGEKCAVISDESSRFTCYMIIAVKTKDVKLCEKITDEELKNECIKLLKKPDTPTISCQDVPPPVCALHRTSGGSTHLEGEGGRDIQCTYYTRKDLDYPLYNEMSKLGKIRDGMYKQYYKSGNIKVASQHTDGKFDGYAINCSEDGELTRCQLYDNGKATESCMPE